MMKLNEFVSVLSGVEVEVINIFDNKIIYKGMASGIKRNAKMFKKYEVTGVISDKEASYDLQIGVTKER